MRCLVLITERLAGRGGVERLLHLLGSTLTERQWGYAVAMMEPPEISLWASQFPYPVHVCGIRGGPGAFRRQLGTALRFVRGVVKQLRPDVVLITAPVGAMLLRLAFPEGRRFRVLSWIHNEISSLHGISRLRWCDGHICLTAEGARHLETVTHRPTWPIGNPVKCPDAVLERPSKEDETEFLYMGRLAPEKRVDLLLSSLSTVRGAWVLHIMGDGPERSVLEAQAQHTFAARCVRWHGWLLDPWTDVRRATALVLPSDVEAFSLTLVEAAARGLPLIATDTAGAREIVSSDNGWIVPRQNRYALATVLQEIVDHQRPLPPIDAVVKSVQRFSSHSVLHQLLAVLEAEGQRMKQ